MPSPEPNFLVAGAAKTGTAWLQECLSDHPEVFVPGYEVNYFTANYEKGDDWYLSHFRETDGARAIGEKSPAYMYKPDVPQRIHDWNPDVTLIFIFRDPVARAYSHYGMKLRAGDVSRDVDAELAEGTRFVEEGLYHSHLQRFLEVFDREQIHLFLFDDLKEDSRQFFEGICGAIEVDPDYRPELVDERFHSKRPLPASRTVLNLLTGIARKLRHSHEFFAKSISFLRRTPLTDLFHSLNEGDKEYPEMSARRERELAEYYRDDIEQLSTYFERDLVDDWLKPYFGKEP